MEDINKNEMGERDGLGKEEDRIIWREMCERERYMWK